jgi:hypothetical protein
MSSKKRQQTAAKRDRERAVEQKRTLKRQKKQEAAAYARAVRDGIEPPPGEPTSEPAEDVEPAPTSASINLRP